MSGLISAKDEPVTEIWGKEKCSLSSAKATAQDKINKVIAKMDLLITGSPFDRRENAPLAIIDRESHSNM
jgi:hypothetical protein